MSRCFSISGTSGFSERAAVLILTFLLCSCGKKETISKNNDSFPVQEKLSGQLPSSGELRPLTNKEMEAREILAKGLKAQLARNYLEAIDLFSRAKEIDPKLQGVDYQMAVSAMNMGKDGEAGEYARKSIAGHDSVVQSYNLLAAMAARKSSYKEAEEYYRLGAEAAPADAMIFYNWSETLRAQKKYPEAIEKLRLAIQRNPGEPLYAFKLRLARIENGEEKDLIPDIDREFKVQPPAADWVMTAAAISLKKGNFGDAVKLLLAARERMQPILFFGIMQEDPFFKSFGKRPELAPFYDVNLSIRKTPLVPAAAAPAP